MSVEGVKLVAVVELEHLVLVGSEVGTDGPLEETAASSAARPWKRSSLSRSSMRPTKAEQPEKRGNRYE